MPGFMRLPWDCEGSHSKSTPWGWQSIKKERTHIHMSNWMIHPGVSLSLPRFLIIWSNARLYYCLSPFARFSVICSRKFLPDSYCIICNRSIPCFLLFSHFICHQAKRTPIVRHHKRDYTFTAFWVKQIKYSLKVMWTIALLGPFSCHGH